MKSNIHRRSHCSGWGQANLRGIYPTFKARYKHDSNHRIRMADCMLAAAELAPVPEDITPDDEPHWINPLTNNPDDLLTNRQREEMEYVIWAKGEIVPHFHGIWSWREGDYGFEESYQNSCRYSSYTDEYNANDYLNAEMESNGYIMAKTGEHNVWQVRASRWNTIATVKLDGFDWLIVFAPHRGELVNYTFDLLESSLESCFNLVQTLHRLDCGSEV
jgi:hypothetical protein